MNNWNKRNINLVQAIKPQVRAGFKLSASGRDF